MILSQLRPPLGSKKRRKIVGRGPGSGHGKTSCRGQKGQMARAGRGPRLGFEGGQMPLVRRIPKRGFHNHHRVAYQVVNVRDLERIEADVITPEILLKEKLVERETMPVKILGEGEIKKPKRVAAHRFSAKAIEKIKKAGGTIEILQAPNPQGQGAGVKDQR